jgi:uncharacterized membrane protein YdjX (TVP38/TMEM64 family)
MMISITNRRFLLAALVLLVVALGLSLRHFESLDWLVRNEIKLRELVAQHPLRAWVVGFAIYAIVTLVPGTGGKAVVFGWLFGFWRAVLLVDLALTTAAVITFVASRYLIQDLAEQNFSRVTQRLNRGLAADGVFYLLMVRLAHVPYTLVNYGAGATTVPLRTFAWTTLVGLLPGTMVFVFVGTQIPTLGQIAEQGVWRLLDPVLIAVLIAAIVLPSTLHWLVHRFNYDADN